MSTRTMPSALSLLLLVLLAAPPAAAEDCRVTKDGEAVVDPSDPFATDLGPGSYVNAEYRARCPGLDREIEP